MYVIAVVRTDDEDLFVYLADTREAAEQWAVKQVAALGYPVRDLEDVRLLEERVNIAVDILAADVNEQAWDING